MASLQHHERRQWCITIVFFFLNTEKTKHARTTKKNQEKGRNLSSSSCSTLSFLALTSTLPLQALLSSDDGMSTK